LTEVTAELIAQQTLGEAATAICEAINPPATTWRIERGLDRGDQPVRAPEPLLRTFKVGPKRKLRMLGDVRTHVLRERTQCAVVAA
jgi:hypothetical protein